MEDIYIFLKDRIKGKRLILFGEMHGTREIPSLVLRFFKRYARTQPFTLCLEIPHDQQELIDCYFETGKESLLKSMPFFQNPEKGDGRNSKEFLFLIKNVFKLHKKNKNILIKCVDTSIPPTDTNQREGILAENMLKSLSKNQTFALLGNVHASKKEILFQSLKIRPAGFVLAKKLKSKMLTVNLWPLKGTFFNFGVKRIGSLPHGLEEYYDCTILLDRVSHCKLN